jgi:hypothetical protein
VKNVLHALERTLERGGIEHAANLKTRAAREVLPLPLDRSSMTVTSFPAASSWSTRWLPMKPAPPVTATLAPDKVITPRQLPNARDHGRPPGPASSREHRQAQHARGRPFRLREASGGDAERAVALLQVQRLG